MLRFLLLTLTVCLGCALIIGEAIAIGRTQPPSEAVRWFHMDDCEQPCFMGVTVGKKIALDEIRQRLTRIAAPSGFKLGPVAENGSNNEWYISLPLMNDTDSKPESEISLSLQVYKGIVQTASIGNFNSFLEGQTPLTVADVVRLYGYPSCAAGEHTDTDYSRRIYFIKGNYIPSSKDDYFVEIYVKSDRPINWDSKVTSMTIAHSFREQGNPCSNSRWQGITIEDGNNYDAHEE